MTSGRLCLVEVLRRSNYMSAYKLHKLRRPRSIPHYKHMQSTSINEIPIVSGRAIAQGASIDIPHL